MRVVIGEDSVLLREGIARILAEGGCEVVAQAGDAEDLVRKVRAHKPDVAVIDIRMPPTHSDEGLRAAREIRAAAPDIGILVLSQYVDEHYAVALLAEGADGVGYLLKDRIGEVERFLDAVSRVAAGGSVLDPEVVAHMVGRKRDEGPLAELSPRERQVLELMAQGLSNKAIREQLVVTERAVEHHITSIFNKLGLSASGQEHRRVLAVLTYLER
ncbi:MAG TPA: response regulator transcription factor [Solirubrobacteraceae bacterium]|nr:response regulator transcription factor [Solirubrobacteraceae bacterium]